MRVRCMLVNPNIEARLRALSMIKRVRCTNALELTSGAFAFLKRVEDHIEEPLNAMLREGEEF